MPYGVLKGDLVNEIDHSTCPLMIRGQRVWINYCNAGKFLGMNYKHLLDWEQLEVDSSCNEYILWRSWVYILDNLEGYNLQLWK